MFTGDMIEAEDGIFVDESKLEATNNDVEGHYEKKAIKILDDDRYHYTCLKRFLESRKLIRGQQILYVCVVFTSLLPG